MIEKQPVSRRNFLKGLAALYAASRLGGAKVAQGQTPAPDSAPVALSLKEVFPIGADVTTLPSGVSIEGKNPIATATIAPSVDVSAGCQIYVAVEGTGRSYGWQITNGRELGDPDLRRAGLSTFQDELFFFYQDGSQIDLSPEGLRARRQFTMIEPIGKIASGGPLMGGLSVSPDGLVLKALLAEGASREFTLPSSLVEKSPDKKLSLDVVALEGSTAKATEINIVKNPAVLG